MLIEWIETYRLYGVTKFGLYNGNITDNDTVAVLNYYSDLGLVDFRSLPPSVENDSSEEAVRLSSPASLNDCMMRHMYAARFVVVADVDEIIVPRRYGNYTSLIREVDRLLGLNASYYSYSFRNAYFYGTWPKDETQPKFLRTMTSRRRSQPGDYLFHTKSFVDPRRCLSVYNHYCWIPFPNSGEGLEWRFGRSVDVDPDIALLHHYRYQCQHETELCKIFDSQQTVDDVMLKYREHLIYAVSAVMRVLGMNSSIAAFEVSTIGG
jgi:Glycosyltransferase family 92